MTDTEARFLRWRDGLPPMAAPPTAAPGMDLRPLVALLVDNGLRVRSGRVRGGTLILDLEADRFDGGGIWVHELPANLSWTVTWDRRRMADRVGTATLSGDGWELRLVVAEEVA